MNKYIFFLATENQLSILTGCAYNEIDKHCQILQLLSCNVSYLQKLSKSRKYNHVCTFSFLYFYGCFHIISVKVVHVL